MTTRPRRALLAAAAVAGLLATGCDSGTAPSEPAASAPSSTVPTTRSTPSPRPRIPPVTLPTPTRPLPLTKAMTSPGARLRFGQQAIVPIRSYDRLGKATDGVLGVTVMSIRRTPASRLRGYFDDESRAILKRGTAYYVQVLITNESGHALPLGPPRVEGSVGDEWPTSISVIGGELPGCPRPRAPENFDHKGARWTTCAFAVSTPSRPVRSFEWNEPPYGPDPFVAPAYKKKHLLGTITWH